MFNPLCISPVLSEYHNDQGTFCNGNAIVDVEHGANLSSRSCLANSFMNTERVLLSSSQGKLLFDKSSLFSVCLNKFFFLTSVQVCSTS